MIRILLYLLESILCGGLLLAFYQLLLARRAPYRFCRGWLLAAAVLAVAIPALRLPLLPRSSTAAAVLEAVESATLVLETDASAPAQVLVPGAGASADAPGSTPVSVPPGQRVLTGLYVFVALLLLAMTLWRIVRIRRLRRTSRLTGTSAFALAENPAVNSPFSFGRTIYIGPETGAEERAMVIAHEASHVAHHHTAEKLFLTLWRSLFWFNPFLWVMERNLAEIQEYQADADVLGQGYDLQAYRYAIFRQLFGHEPDLTSAMSHSLTRRRFERMGDVVRRTRLLPRAVAAGLLLAALLLAFGTTARPRFVPFAAERDGIGLLEEVVITKYAAAGVKGSAIRTKSQAYPLRKTPGITPWGELPVKPVFSQGLHAWVENNLSYPESCMNQGRVEVTFTIDAEGRIKDIALVQGVCPELDDAVLTLVQYHFPLSLPAAGRDTTFVASQCILPVTFRIRTDRQRKVDERVAALQARWTALPLNEVDEKPAFKDGGVKDFTPWIHSQLRYSEAARAWHQANGKRGGAVVCQLTVTRTGRVKRVSLLRGSGSPMDAEILRTVRSSPKWARPAYKDGKPAAVRMNVPIFYQIPDD